MTIEGETSKYMDTNSLGSMMKAMIEKHNTIDSHVAIVEDGIIIMNRRLDIMKG